MRKTRAESLRLQSPSELVCQRIAAWSEVSLDAAALIFFPLLVLLPRGIAALASAAGFCAAGLVLSTTRHRQHSALAIPAVVLGCLIVWGVISAMWSVDPIRSLTVALRLGGLFAAGLALLAAARCVAAPYQLTLISIVGLILGIGLAMSELATNGALNAELSERPYRTTELNQASISVAILLFPIAAALFSRGYKVGAVLLATAAAAMVWILPGTAAKGVLIAGLAMGLTLYRSGPFVARAAAVVSIIIIVTTPLSFARLERLATVSAAADNVKLSAGHRLLIWSFVGDRIAEHPLTGWGLDSSRAIPGGDDPIRPDETWLPLHPHNAPLQLWLELGVPGVVLFALLVALLWRGLARTAWPPIYFAAAGASLTVAFVGCFATYGIWQEWWVGTLWFALFLIVVMARVVLPAAAVNETSGSR